MTELRKPVSDISELIERLRETAALYVAGLEDKDLHTSKILRTATALKALQAENERLRAFAQDVLQHGPYNWQNSARAALGAKP